MKISCSACHHTVDSEQETRLLTDITKWINFVIATHLKKGGTATLLKKSPDCPPCPACGAKNSWQNAV